MKMEILMRAGTVRFSHKKTEVGVCVCVVCLFVVVAGLRGAFKLPELCAKDLHYQVKDT